MNTAVSEACAFGAALSLYEEIAPSSASATEQRAVEVSMSIILDMFYQKILRIFGRIALVVDSMIGNSVESVKIASLKSVNR